jgi:tetratricopeptide (TPR) repeat protein
MREHCGGRGSSWLTLPYARFVTAAIALLIAMQPLARGDDDPLIDAHRQEVADLMRKGDYKEATALCKDILKSDPTHYQDHLCLAHAYDKTSHPDLALVEYQAVRDLVPASGQNNDQFHAYTEAVHRIQMLDPSADKLQRALADFDKQLQTLERSCRESHDKAGFDRIAAIREQMAALVPSRTHVVLDLSAKTNWLDTGMSVVAGQKYQVIATGTWGTLPSPQSPSDADGVPNVMINGFKSGMLLGTIAGGPPFPLGKAVTFVASESGELRLAINDSEDGRADNWGTQHIYIGLALPDDSGK